MSKWLAAVLVLALSFACSDPPPPPATVAQPPPPSSAPEPPPMQPTWLYRVTTDTQPSYVFAALDGGCPLHDAFPSDYTVLFQFARLVIVPTAQTEEEAAAAMESHAIDRSGSLVRVIGAERMETLVEVVHDALGRPLVPYLRPISAIGYMVLSVQADAYGGHMTDGRMSPLHDAVSRRRMTGAELLGLYESDELERMLRGLEPDAPDALRAYLDHEDAVREEARTRLARYRAGDEAEMTRGSDEHVPGTEDFEVSGTRLGQQLLDTHWERLQTELRAGNTLAVLSTEDVLGEHGVLARLRASGVEVTRISLPAPVP